MRYILAPDIALRSWRRVPYACYVRHQRNARGLKRAEYELLSLCDGEFELEEGPLLRDLLRRGLCVPAREGDKLAEWQKPMTCDNRYFPAMSWMITGKCNFNCLHCFNAADNARLQSEFTLEEAKRLVAEARACGVNAVTITGGEPMLHPHFMDILRDIHANGMYVMDLNTNGFFLTQEILDEMREIGCDPLMKISFDGLGHHDWLRGREGAEADALRAMELCIKNGFRVKAQTNVHRLNRDAMLPTARLLADMGVSEMRIIRTTEAPRWVQNAGDACLGLEEYFGLMLDFAAEYIRTDAKMDVDIWQFLTLHPAGRTFRPRPAECAPGEYRDSFPVCRGNRGMIAVDASGELHPCHQLSGWYKAHGVSLGSVKERGLQPLLREGAYLDEVCTTLADLKAANPECAACQWFQTCCGGCRAIAMALTEDRLGVDPSKCRYFKGGWDERVRTMLAEAGWTTRY